MLPHIKIADSTILANKAYGPNEILDYIQIQDDADYAISPKSNTRVLGAVTGGLYNKRHLVECFF